MLYIKIAELYQQLENTSKRLEKTKLISEFLKTIPKEDLKVITYLLQGRIFPQWDDRKLGMSSQLLIKTIAKSTGESKANIEASWKKLGDLGDVAEQLSKNKKQITLFTKKLTLQKVIDNITKITELVGQGTVNKKTSLISELLSYSSPLESKYIIRTVTEDLRTGIGDGTLRDALVWTFFPELEGITTEGKETKESRTLYNQYSQELQHAFDMTTDFGLVAITLKEKGTEGLKKLNLTVGKPLKVMLYQKVEDVVEGFEAVGKPAIIEPKIDGFRMQIHKKDNIIKLYTRRLEDVTKQFPDVVESVKNNIKCDHFILDSEIVGFDSNKKRFVSFQQISQRIRRKHDIEEMIKKLPVVVNIFDAMEINGKNLINEPLAERRKLMESIINNKKHELELIEQLVTDDPKKAEEYYRDCLGKGHEGVMMKNLEGIYKPGSRVGFGVKVKPVMESLDLVITKADWGEGKRVAWLSSFTLSCRDDDKLLEMGKVGTGIKEKSEEGLSFEQLTKELKPLIISERAKSVKVKPKIVVEVYYEEIQKSPKYSSGFALRFPRVVRLRDDKSVSDISTIQEITKLYNSQRGRHK